MGRTTFETMKESDSELYRGTPIPVLSSTMVAGPQPTLGRSPVTVHGGIDGLRTALGAAGIRRVYVDGGRTVTAVLARGPPTDIIGDADHVRAGLPL